MLRFEVCNNPAKRSFCARPPTYTVISKLIKLTLNIAVRLFLSSLYVEPTWSITTYSMSSIRFCVLIVKQNTTLMQVAKWVCCGAEHVDMLWAVRMEQSWNTNNLRIYFIRDTNLLSFSYYLLGAVQLYLHTQ